MFNRFSRLAATSVLILGALAGSASAAEIEVKMLNSDGEGKRMLFQPDFIKANVGDTVKFILAEMPHNAESIPELWPEGVPTFKGKLNEEITITIDKPGIYGIKCMPHYTMGMIAMIVAGDEHPNKDQLDTYKPKGKESTKRFEEFKAQLAAQ
ncbi:pseudoazurin [Hyphomicrobium sp.]|uniref:pseudoazurin n=1 Tax=Hyphomicrobium sp. TaxID=82 RepID=UPI002CF45BF4|nr:pseudoazurin [Hyphomicrobium sp.]HRN88710.1 pseudoazurin [Hyphomicrobium sp.]HRQ25865.1 pseudoazurin [Hyphomicrobium sp.]